MILAPTWSFQSNGGLNDSQKGQCSCHSPRRFRPRYWRPLSIFDGAILSGRVSINAELTRGVCDDLRSHRLFRRYRAVEGAWPRRSPERGQPDRLLLSQTRRLQALASLVRAGAESGSEPCADLELLRSVADRAGQPRAGGISFEPDRYDLRNRLRGVSIFGGGAGKTARHKSRLLSAAATPFNERVGRAKG